MMKRLWAALGAVTLLLASTAGWAAVVDPGQSTFIGNVAVPNFVLVSTAQTGVGKCTFLGNSCIPNVVLIDPTTGLPAARSSDIANALDYGADPTDNMAADSSAAINAALTATANGRLHNVRLSAGTYHITHALNVGSASQGQCLVGDGAGSTILHISSDFDPTALGVILPSTTTGLAQPCVKGVQFLFDQPNDIQTAATAATTVGGTTIQVASAAGIVAGMIVMDHSATTAMSNVFNNGALVPTAVSSISGNVITLNRAVAGSGVGNGDTINFGSARSQMLTLAQGCTVVVGGTGCKYPWAIYSPSGSNNQFYDDILIAGAWDGIYQRGSTFHWGRIQIGALDVAADVDNCFNFPQIDDFTSYEFGFQPSTTGDKDAFHINYYDGSTIAANFGRTDGIAIKSLQTWVGKVILTANWTFGSADYLMLDGSNANLSINSTSPSGFFQVGNLYSTKQAQTFGTAVFVGPTGAAFDFEVANIQIVSASAYNSPIAMNSGIFSIKGGYFWNGQQASRAFVAQTGGMLNLTNMRLDASAGRTDTYINQTNGVLHMGSNIDFPTAPGSGAVGLSAHSNVLNAVSPQVGWNGWKTSGTVGGGAQTDLSGPAPFALTTAGYTVPSNISLVRWNQGGTIASATVTLPASAADTQALQFVNYAGAVTALTFSPSVSGWTNGSALAANTGLRIRWDAAAAAWQREQ